MTASIDFRQKLLVHPSKILIALFFRLFKKLWKETGLAAAKFVNLIKILFIDHIQFSKNPKFLYIF